MSTQNEKHWLVEAAEEGRSAETLNNLFVGGMIELAKPKWNAKTAQFRKLVEAMEAALEIQATPRITLPPKTEFSTSRIRE